MACFVVLAVVIRVEINLGIQKKEAQLPGMM